MIVFVWIAVSAGASAILACLMISFMVSLKLTRNNVRKPINESPEDYGLDFELISFQSTDDVSLKGWFIPAQKPGNRTIIFAHGYWEIDWKRNCLH